MKNVPVLFNAKQFNNLHALLNEAYFRADDNILTCCLKREQIEELIEACN